jgi:hypothetical protein
MSYSINGLDPEILGNLNKNKELFKKTYGEMFSELASKDIKVISENSGSEVLSDSKLILSFFERKVLIDLKYKKVYYPDKADSSKRSYVDMFSSAIILHYLLSADGASLENKWISYRELPGGLFYSSTIPVVLKPLVKRFEADGKEFLEKSLEIGGTVNSNFEYGAIIYPFKRFPVLLVLYEKSEEFEANIKTLFDSSASHYLKTYIIKLVITYIVKRLGD